VINSEALESLDLSAFYEDLAYRGLDFIPHEKQRKFLEAPTYTSLLSAGNGFGKTKLGCHIVARHALGSYPDDWNGRKFNRAISIWIAAPKYETIQRVIIPYLFGNENVLGMIPASYILKENRIGSLLKGVQIRHSSGGVSSLLFKSYKSPASEFESEKVDLILLDEPPPIRTYTACVSRLRDDGRGQGIMIITATPVGESGMSSNIPFFLDYMQRYNEETKEQEFIPPETPYEGKFYMHGSWDDSPHLTEDTKNFLRSAIPAHELQAREKGIPSFHAGLVHPVPEKEFVINPIPIPNHWAKICGMDIGWDHPTTVVFLAKDRDSGKIYLYSEYKKSYLNVAQHVTNLSALGVNKIPTFCDPSGRQTDKESGRRLIDSYRQAGLNLIPSRYAKEFAVTEINKMLAEGDFKVFSTCRSWLSEYRLYARDGKGKILKGNDDLMDATQFAVLELGKARTEHEHSLHQNYSPPIF